MTRDFAPACERNKDPILSVLREVLPAEGLVLEIGSGTGQHAEYFSRSLPHIQWQPTDVPTRLDSIAAYREESSLPNFLAPLGLDLASGEWPVARAQAIVCINTIHIVAWPLVVKLFAGTARVLDNGGVFFAYGPYRYPHRPLEPSNEQFDAWLRARDPVSGVRDFDAVNALARGQELMLEGDRPMPANNRSIWWRKMTGTGAASGSARDKAIEVVEV